MAFESEAPQLGFDRLLAELVDQGTTIMATRSRLRELVGVNRDLVSHLDLTTVLQRIVEVAVELIGADRAAITVLSVNGTLDGVTQVGMTESEVDGVARPLTEDGFLSAFLGGSAVLGDRRSLSVPILLRGRKFASLHVADGVRGGFEQDDRELAHALADSASIAIENARLYEDSQHRRRVDDSIVELHRLMSRDDQLDPIEELMTRLHQYVRADLVDVVTLTATRSDFVVDHAQGHGAEGLKQATFPIKGSPLREAMMRTTGATNFDDISTEQTYGFAELADLGPLISVPISVDQQITGFLCAVRMVGEPAFTERDTRTVEAFGVQLQGIYERRRTRVSKHLLSQLEDRERIARDLHDHVIQRLFATGMNLQVAAGRSDEATAAAVEQQIQQIDGAIAQIRQSIFAIRASEKSSGSRLRPRVMEVVERLSTNTLHPTVTFLGPVDLMVDGDLTDDVVAAAAEGLTTAVRHPGVTAVSLTVQAGEGRVQVDVFDDGDGRPDDAGSTDEAGLRRRAEARGGSLVVRADPAQGTRLTWTAEVR